MLCFLGKFWMERRTTGGSTMSSGHQFSTARASERATDMVPRIEHASIVISSDQGVSIVVSVQQNFAGFGFNKRKLKQLVHHQNAAIPALKHSTKPHDARNAADAQLAGNTTNCKCMLISFKAVSPRPSNLSSILSVTRHGAIPPKCHWRQTDLPQPGPSGSR
jgi:hypothetical protein